MGRRFLFFFCVSLLVVGAVKLSGYVVSFPVFFEDAHLGGRDLDGPGVLEQFAANAYLLPHLEVATDASIRHRVKAGDSLFAIADSYGLSSTVAGELHLQLLELKKKKGLNTTLRAGQDLYFYFAEDGRLEALKLSVPSGRGEIEVLADSAGRFAADYTAFDSHQRERVVLGAVESSFASALRSSGVCYDVVDEIVDLLGDRISFGRDFRKGDPFTIIYEELLTEDGVVVGAGDILGAAISAGGRDYIAIRYEDKGGKEYYFDGQLELLGNRFLRYPLKFSRISSTYSRSRVHPIFGEARPHLGVDFAAPTGTPVRSVADGKIVFAGRKGGNGIMLKVRHTKRYQTAYLHLSRLAKGSRRGRPVKRGQVIGYVGSTGWSTGPHLDFRFYDRGKMVNPLTVNLPTVESPDFKKKVDRSYLKRVRATLRRYQAADRSLYNLW